MRSRLRFWCLEPRWRLNVGMCNLDQLNGWGTNESFHPTEPISMGIANGRCGAIGPEDMARPERPLLGR